MKPFSAPHVSLCFALGQDLLRINVLTQLCTVTSTEHCARVRSVEGSLMLEDLAEQPSETLRGSCPHQESVYSGAKKKLWL